MFTARSVRLKQLQVQKLNKEFGSLEVFRTKLVSSHSYCRVLGRRYFLWARYPCSTVVYEGLTPPNLGWGRDQMCTQSSPQVDFVKES